MTDHIFDMDGVLLDSNGIKSRAFYNAALPYGEYAADWMVEYHRNAGSISRRARVEAFFEQLDIHEDDVEGMLANIAGELVTGYQSARLVPGVETYLRALDEPKYVVSGVATEELTEILQAHGLARYFAGIYGGVKTDTLKALLDDGTLHKPATYYGDTQQDYEAAKGNGLDFVFVSAFSEFSEWRPYFARKKVRVVRDFTEIAPFVERVPLPSKVRVGGDGYALVGGERRFYGRNLAGAVVNVEQL